MDKMVSFHATPWSKLILLETLCTCQCIERYPGVTETVTILVRVELDAGSRVENTIKWLWL